MTALNKTLRTQIIASVIEKGTTIPARKEDLIRRTEARVRQLCLERVPKDFAAAVKTLPPEWFPIVGSETMEPQVCPLAIIKLSSEAMARSWRYAVSFEPFRHPMGVSFSRVSEAVKNGKESDPESWESKLKDLIDEAHKIMRDEGQACTELRQFLASVNNYKQVLEKMPELEKHLPNYTKPMPLVVQVGPILKTLGKLGFDQAKKDPKP